MEMTPDDIYVRADSYKFLSDCYYLPDDSFIQRVADISQKNQFFADLASHVRTTAEIEALKVDFTKLFVGPFKLLAPPYGSVYLEDDRMLGESTVDVKNRYESEGLDVVIKDAPDHIAMELEFMYYLITKQAGASETEDVQSFQQKQYSFLTTHLARWLPEFAKNIQINAQTDFYRKLAQLTEGFLRKDMEIFSLCDA